MSFAESWNTVASGVALRDSGQSKNGWIGSQGIILLNAVEGVFIRRRIASWSTEVVISK